MKSDQIDDLKKSDDDNGLSKLSWKVLMRWRMENKEGLRSATHKIKKLHIRTLFCKRGSMGLYKGLQFATKGNISEKLHFWCFKDAITIMEITSTSSNGSCYGDHKLSAGEKLAKLRSFDVKALVAVEVAESDSVKQTTVVGDGVEDVYGEDSATEDHFITIWSISVARPDMHKTENPQGDKECPNLVDKDILLRRGETS